MAKMMSGKKRNSFKIELLVVFAILVSIGFPGNYAVVYGKWLETLMIYAAFIFEIVAMLLSSGDNWQDVQILNLDKKYAVLYFFAAVIFIESMIVTSYPSLQFITCARLVVTILFAIWIQDQFEFDRMVELFGIAQAIFVIFTIFFTIQYPNVAWFQSSAFIKEFMGLFTTKNNCASELGFGIILYIFLIRQKIKKSERYQGWAVFLFIQIAMMLSCQAIGAVVTTACVLIILLILHVVRIPIGWAYTACSILFLFLVLTLMPAFEWIFTLLGKDATLTGRIPLWNQIIRVMMEHNTFTGYGYGMFWRTPEAVILVQSAFDETKNYFLANVSTGAHNTIMEFWVNNGLIGIAVLFISVIYSMRKIKEFSAEKYIFCSLFLFFIMISGFTERALGGNYDYKIFTFFLIMAIGCKESEALETVLSRKTFT